ncbi:MAG: hypothetical protein IT384_13805 [Deltaproteobacteria bacterium]|nr:hypothetical protein [Deltaproteobacteria bacterium]
MRLALPQLPCLAAIAAIAGIATAGCSQAPGSIELPDEYDWIVVWSVPTEGQPSGQILRRRGPVSIATPRRGRTFVLGYRTADLAFGPDFEAEALDRTPVVELEGCGPALPLAARSVVIDEGGPREATRDEVPALRATRLTCADANPGRPYFVTPRSERVLCPTSSAAHGGSCVLCLDLVPCGVEGSGGEGCSEHATVLRTRLDGTLCDAPIKGGASCEAVPPLPGATSAFSCQRPDETPLTTDVGPLEGVLDLGVTHYVLADGPPFRLLPENGQSAESVLLLRAGRLVDFVAFDDHLVVLRRPAGVLDTACRTPEISTLLFVSLEGQLLAERALTLPCVSQIEPDPEERHGLLAAALEHHSARLTVARLDRDGVLRGAPAGRTLATPLGSPTLLARELMDVVVTGTIGAFRVTVISGTAVPSDDHPSWTTWSLRPSGLELIDTHDDLGPRGSGRYLFAVPAGPPAHDQEIAISDDDLDGLLLMDPLTGAVTATVARSFAPGEIASGPLVTESRGGRWLIASGGASAGAVTTFGRRGELSRVSYLIDNTATLTGILEIAPDRFLVVAWHSEDNLFRSGLAILDTSPGRVGFQPRSTALGDSMAGHLMTGARCPDGVRVKTAWGLLPWVGELLRLDLRCD